MTQNATYIEAERLSWADVTRDSKTLDMDLQAIVENYPALSQNGRAMLTLALKEYELRRSRGEEIPIMEFAARFPACRSILCKQLLAWQCTDAVWTDEELLGKSLAKGAPSPGRPQWPSAGDRVRGFTIITELGQGAFARVYLAIETALGDRPVALKLSREGKDLPDASLEADILGRLRHENVVPIYSVQDDPLSGCTVVCMPYLGHTTLSNLLDHVYDPPLKVRDRGVIVKVARTKTLHQDALVCEEPIPVLREGTYIDGVIELGAQLAKALAFVHERKILHRDLKPSNVLLRPDGRPMLLDFNLSLAESQRGGKRVEGGTLLYMSPEHLRATAKNSDHRPALIDARSDLYSLGVILYELLAGDHPFLPWHSPETGLGEERIRELLGQRQGSGPPSLCRANPLLDRRLARTIEKCLAYEPAERFASAAELATALRECLQPLQRAKRWAIRQPRSFWPGVAAGFFALVVAAVLAVRLSSVPPFERGIRALQAGEYKQAVSFFNHALTEEESRRGHMARARAYQKLGEFSNALKDFTRADELRPTGNTKACMAYSCNQLDPPKHKVASAYYRQAITRGYQTASILNNLGFSIASATKAPSWEAKKHLRKAIALDSNCQMAYYNLMRADLDPVYAGYRGAQLTKQGLAALENVFKTGPVTGTVHKHAARFFVLAHSMEPNWKECALSHLRQAANRGVSRSSLQADIILRPLRNEPEFLRAINSQATAAEASPVVDISRVQDPFLSIDE